MGTTKRMRISQRTSQQQIMLMLPALRITASEKHFPYRASMFIAQKHPFVNMFLSSESHEKETADRLTEQRK